MGEKKMGNRIRSHDMKRGAYLREGRRPRRRGKE